MWSLTKHWSAHHLHILSIWILSASMLCASVGRAQSCGPGWLPGSFPGANFSVYASVWWDPDGAGPKGPLLVVGGDFQFVGTIFANRVAAYDPATEQWSALGQGFDSRVNALAVLSNGDLIAGSDDSLQTSHGIYVTGVSRWNGSAWTALGPESIGNVNAMLALPNGELIVAGKDASPPFNRIAKWNGSAWTALGSGLNNTVRALTRMPNGDIIAGGDFSTAGGVPAAFIARWNGAVWSAIGTVAAASVYALAVEANGNLLAGRSAGALIRWNGSTWSSIGNFAHSGIRAIVPLPDGQILIGGTFTSGTGQPGQGVARWNGSAWTALGAGISGSSFRTVYTLATLPGGRFFAGGGFTLADGTFTPFLAMWNGSRWRPLNSGVNDGLRCVLVCRDGTLVVGGYQRVAGDATINFIGRWDGARWTPLGSGMDGAVWALIELPDGRIVAGGDFTTAGGVPSYGLSIWNGSSWARPVSLVSSVYALAAFSNDRVAFAGNFPTRVALWDGTTSTSVGSGLNGDVNAVAFLSNGDLVAGGAFTTASGSPVSHVARWNGSQWVAMGDGLAATVDAMITLPNGDLVAACSTGASTGASGLNTGVARWNGSSWSPVGSTTPIPRARCLAVSPNGDIVAGGSFTITKPDGQRLNRIARWTGSDWMPFGRGIDDNPLPEPQLFSSIVYAVGCLPNGDVYAGGSFTLAGDTFSACLAHWDADAVPVVVKSPMPQTLTPGQTLMLSAMPAADYSNVSVRWHRNGVPIVNGPSGASAIGGLVSGASQVLESPTRGAPAVLTILGAQPSDAGSYTAVFASSCGSVTSVAASVTIGTQPCNPADLCGVGATYDNGDVDIGPDGQLTIEDFLNFLSAFGDSTGCPGIAPCNPADLCGPGATYDNGAVDIGPDGQLTIEDFLTFLSAYGDATGCP